MNDDRNSRNHMGDAMDDAMNAPDALQAGGNPAPPTELHTTGVADATHWRDMSQDEALAAYTADELDAATQAAFATHLAQCASCQLALAQTQAIRAALRSLAMELPPAVVNAPVTSLADAFLAQAQRQPQATQPDGVRTGATENTGAALTVPAPATAAPISPPRPLSPPNGVSGPVAYRTPTTFREAPEGHATSQRRSAPDTAATTGAANLLVEGLAERLAARRSGRTIVSERRNTSNGADEHDSANSTPTRTKGIRSRTPLAAIAAALIVALLGAGLFGVLESHARHPGGTISKTNQTHTGTAPVLSLDPNVKVDPKTGYPPNTIFSSIQMLSANDGWAVGGWNQGTNSNNNKNGVVIAHYADGAWTLIFDDESGYSLNSVSLDSPDDGWAVGDFGALLHYSAGKWRAVSAPNISFYLSLIKVQMFSETEGWALASNGQVSNVQGSSYKFLHYLNGSWTVMPTPLTGLKDLSLDSASHGWAVGSDAHTQLAQYVNGQWQTFSQAPSEEFLSVSSLSPTDAWATGYPIVCSCQSAPTSSASRTNATSLQGALALNRPMNGMVGMNILHFDGVRWSRVPLNVPAYDNFGFITMLSANEGWALGVSVPPPNGPGYTLALHYQNGVWQVTNLHLEGQINAASFTSANDGWAVGGDDTGAPGSGGAPLFLHYHNGAWSVYHS